MIEDVNYIENSIALSRTYQEQANCLQGVTGYGKFASLIGANMKYLDSFAEHMALCLSKSIAKGTYEVQYGGEFLDNDRTRRNLAFLGSLLTEAGIKYGMRGIKSFAEEKEQQIYFETVFFVLKSFLEESDQYVYYDKANSELQKIVKAFPIDSKKKQQLWERGCFGNYEKIEEFGNKLDSNARYSLTYLLYALHVQKYGGNFGEIRTLAKYYSLLGYQDGIINEIILENRDAYSVVAFDQKRYLSLARGMIKQFNNCAPNLDLNRLIQRAVEMAKFDPYYSDELDLRQHRIHQDEKTVSDIFFKSPETVINACKIAVSQLLLDDNIKENIEKVMKSWKIDIGIIATILNQTDKFQKDIRG